MEPVAVERHVFPESGFACASPGADANRTQVVAGAVRNANDAVFATLTGHDIGMPLQHEAGSRGRAADRALGLEPLSACVECLLPAGKQPGTLCRGLPSVLPGVVALDQFPDRSVAVERARRLGAAASTAIVPAGSVEPRGQDPVQFGPTVDAVLGHHRAGLRVAEHRLEVIADHIRVIGDNQAVAAKGSVIDRFVFEPAEQALLGQQALHESQVAFLELGGDRTLRIDAAIGNLPAPDGLKPAFAGPVSEHLVDDLEDRSILEDVAVPSVAKERKPGLDPQQVSRESAIAPQPAGARAVPVEGTALVARLAGEQVDPQWLSEQRIQIQSGISRQRGQLDPEAGMLAVRPKTLDCIKVFGQQHILPKRGAKPQQTICLLPSHAIGERRNVDHRLTRISNLLHDIPVPGHLPAGTRISSRQACPMTLLRTPRRFISCTVRSTIGSHCRSSSGIEVLITVCIVAPRQCAGSSTKAASSRSRSPARLHRKLSCPRRALAFAVSRSGATSAARSEGRISYSSGPALASPSRRPSAAVLLPWGRNRA